MFEYRSLFILSSVRIDGESADRHVLASLAAPKLDPFRPTDLPRGVFADASDSLGRVWYHIPNLGPKFCDAVRKYSVVANFREAHVIARKKSKDSECMWIGIVGDPAEYTTGSKRHIIEFMFRNPGLALDQSANRRAHTRIRTNKTINPLKKRRRKRRRPVFPILKTDSSCGGLSLEERVSPQDDTAEPTDSLSEAGSSADDDISSHTSSTPSMIAIDRQVSGQYGFGLREAASSPLLPLAPANITASEAKSKLNLPPATSILSLERGGDWLDTIHTGAHFYMLREPPVPSPEARKTFSLHKSNEPPSPEVKVVRKYSVEDLNQLLTTSELDVI